LKRPDIADRMIPGNWKGTSSSEKNGASACATLVERTTRYLITRGPASGAQGRPGLWRAHTPHPRPTRRSDTNT